MSIPYRNISFATVRNFKDVLSQGSTVNVRGEETRELRNRVTSLLRPIERLLFIPGRNHNVFAQIAETMWVIAGRNDVPWLARYLERAPEFSDDEGATWHGAYGPRLRAWTGGIDQIDEWRKMLIADPMTRRAAGVLYDPTRDYVPSKDIPCNNWLSWLQRDGRLNLNVAVRSNDGMWGFSGINAFEWSVLQEMLAFWVDAELGDITFFATSYHVYKRHYERAEKIVRGFYGLSPYDFGITSPRFSTDWADFPQIMRRWFESEQSVSSDPNNGFEPIGDPLLRSMLAVIRLMWGSRTWPAVRLKDELAALPENDLTAAAYEYFGRQNASLLEEIPHPNIARFFQACRLGMVQDDVALKAAIERLHARKNRNYASAWKRRGERVSILPNIARKVDRLDAFRVADDSMDGETALDTAIDLLVYAIKYTLFLSEQPGANRDLLPRMTLQPLSDHDENFNALLRRLNLTSADAPNLAEELQTAFEELWRAADAGAELGERQRLALDFMDRSAVLVGAMLRSYPTDAWEFVRKESAL